MDANYINIIVLMSGDGLLLAYSTPHTPLLLPSAKSQAAKDGQIKYAKQTVTLANHVYVQRIVEYYILLWDISSTHIAVQQPAAAVLVRVPSPSVGKVPISFSNAMVYLTWNMNAGQRDDFCKGVL